MEEWSAHQLLTEAKASLEEKPAFHLKSYAQGLKRSGLPVIFTLGHLSKITKVNYSVLRKTIERRREAANYRMFAIKKRSGGRRHIHAVTKDLLQAQHFINSEVLQTRTPHSSSYAFHSSGGISNCALQHCGARWIFKYDLENFFYSINETDVFKVFKGLGYRPLLAFELARICTTLRLPQHLKFLLDPSKSDSLKESYKFYVSKLNVPEFGLIPDNRLGVLPQGAPTSPMLSNLVAEGLDIELTDFADTNGFVYTRYADDLTISCCDNFPSELSIAKIHSAIVRIIRKHKFKVNRNKTRVLGPGAKKLVLGLLVDASKPRLSRETYKRIDRHLYAIQKYGLAEVSRFEGFDSPIGFYNHLAGLVAFTKDVDLLRWKEFSKKFKNIARPTIK